MSKSKIVWKNAYEKITLNGQAKFAAGVRENKEKFMHEMRENQKGSANEIRGSLKTLV